LVLAALLGSALAAGAPARPPEPARQILRLPTADGQEAAGALFLPAGPPRAGVVLVHGYGGSFDAGVPAHLAPALAGRGFAALAVNLRDHGRGPKTTLFEDGRFDVLAAVEALAARGAMPVVLLGHSLGANTVLYVAAAAPDRRVGAVAVIAAPGNAYEWNVRLFGAERAAAVLAEAEGLRAAGRGAELLTVDLGPLGQARYSADHLVSLRGPATRSDPYRNLARVTVPVLVVQAGADPLVDPGIAERLRRAATAAPRADLVRIAGADHGFGRDRAALVDAVAGWLASALGR
jgi:alpha-beta hydrolase superfamily lysophospholipase